MTRPIAEMTVEEFDEYFDDGGDVSELFEGDGVEIERPNRPAVRRVGLDMNDPMIERLDAYAAEYSVPRQALMKMWLAERLNAEDDRKRASSAA